LLIQLEGDTKPVNVYDYLDKDQDVPPEAVPEEINGSRSTKDRSRDDYVEELMSGALPDKKEGRKSRRKDKEVRIAEDVPYDEGDDLEQSMTSSAFTDTTARTSKSEGYFETSDRRKPKSRDYDDEVRSEPSGRSSRKDRDRAESPPAEERDRDRDRSSKKEKRRSRRERDDDAVSVVSSAVSESSSKKDKDRDRDKDKKKEKGGVLSGIFSRSKTDLTESSSSKSKSKSDNADDDDRERRKRKKERDRDRDRDEEEDREKRRERDADQGEESGRRRRHEDEQEEVESRRESKSKRESKSERSDKRKSRNAEDESFLGERAEADMEEHVVERESSEPLPVTSLVIGGMAAAAAVGGVGAIMHHRNKEKEEEEEKEEKAEEEREGARERHHKYDDREIKVFEPEHHTRDPANYVDVSPSREHEIPEIIPPEMSYGMDENRVDRDLPDVSSRELDLSSKSPLEEIYTAKHVMPQDLEEPEAQIEEPEGKETPFEEVPELPDSRPSSPMEIGSLHDLPELPTSRPGSPYEKPPKTPPRPSLESLRAASTTAVPFRLPGRPPASPIRPIGETLETPTTTRSMGHKKSRSSDFRFSGNRPMPLALVESLRSPLSSDQESPISPFGRRYSFDPAARRESADASPTARGMQTAQRESARRSRTGSTERRTMLEQRPMWLVTKYGQNHSPLVDADTLPPLPPSREESRSPSSAEREPMAEQQPSDPFGPTVITIEPESYSIDHAHKDMENLPALPESRPSSPYEELREERPQIPKIETADDNHSSNHGLEKAVVAAGVGVAALLGASKLAEHLDHREEEPRESQLEQITADSDPQLEAKEVSEAVDPLLVRTPSKSTKKPKKTKKNKPLRDLDSTEPDTEMSTDLETLPSKIVEPTIVADEPKQREDPLLTRTPSKPGKKSKKKIKIAPTIESFTPGIDEQDMAAESSTAQPLKEENSRAISSIEEAQEVRLPEHEVPTILPTEMVIPEVPPTKEKAPTLPAKDESPLVLPTEDDHEILPSREDLPIEQIPGLLPNIEQNQEILPVEDRPRGLPTEDATIPESIEEFRNNADPISPATVASALLQRSKSKGKKDKKDKKDKKGKKKNKDAWSSEEPSGASTPIAEANEPELESGENENRPFDSDDRGLESVLATSAVAEALQVKEDTVKPEKTRKKKKRPQLDIWNEPETSEPPASKSRGEDTVQESSIANVPGADQPIEETRDLDVADGEAINPALTRNLDAQTLEETVGQSSNKSIDDTTGEAADHTFSEAFEESIDKPIDEDEDIDENIDMVTVTDKKKKKRKNRQKPLDLLEDGPPVSLDAPESMDTTPAEPEYEETFPVLSKKKKNGEKGQRAIELLDGETPASSDAPIPSETKDVEQEADELFPIPSKEKKKVKRQQKGLEIPEEETLPLDTADTPPTKDSAPEAEVLSPVKKVNKSKKKKDKNKFIPFDDEAAEEEPPVGESKVTENIPEIEEAGLDQLHEEVPREEPRAVEIVPELEDASLHQPQDDVRFTRSISPPREAITEPMHLDEISHEQSLEKDTAMIDVEQSLEERDVLLPENVELPATDDGDLIESEAVEHEHHHDPQEQSAEKLQSSNFDDDTLERETPERRRASTSTAAEVAAMLRGDPEESERQVLHEVIEEPVQPMNIDEATQPVENEHSVRQVDMEESREPIGIDNLEHLDTKELPQSMDIDESIPAIELEHEPSASGQLTKRSLDPDENSFEQYAGDANPDEEFALLSKKNKKRKEKGAKKDKTKSRFPESGTEVIATEPGDEYQEPTIADESNFEDSNRDIGGSDEPEIDPPQSSKKSKKNMKGKQFEEVEKTIPEGPAPVDEIEPTVLERQPTLEEEEPEFAMKPTKKNKKASKKTKQLERVEENVSEDPAPADEVDSSKLERQPTLENDDQEFSMKPSKKDKKSKKKAAAAAALAAAAGAALVMGSAKDPKESSTVSESERPLAGEDEPETFIVTPSKKNKKNAKKAAKAAKSSKKLDLTSAEDTEISTPAELVEEERNRKGLELEAIKPATSDVELAAASAAALHESGFDPAMVLDDPDFSRPSSRAQGLEEPDFDDFPQHASRKGSRRGSRRQSRSQSIDRGQDGHQDVRPSGTGPIDDKEFAAVLAAGLHQAGFNPDTHFDDRDNNEAQDMSNNDLVEISAMRHSPKSGWGRNIKRRSDEASADKGGVQEAEEAIELDTTSREVHMDEANAELEDGWGVPVKNKKEKRKKKGKGKGKGKVAASKDEDTEQDIPTPKDIEHDDSSNKDVAIGLGAALAAAGATVAASHLIGHRGTENTESQEGESTIGAHEEDRFISQEPHPFEATEGTKRSIPSGFDDSKSPPKKVPRTSESDLKDMDVELPEVPATDSSFQPSKNVREQVSAQDLNQATWSFPINRDSAILVEDSPSLPSTSPKHQDIRDSGFQEPPFTPVVGQISKRDESHTESPKSRRTSHSTPKSPIQVQVEVPNDWDVTVSQDQDPNHEDALRHDRGLSETSRPAVYEENRKSLASFARNVELPPAVESTSKDRTNALLFQSSPSSREAPSFVNVHGDDPEMTTPMSHEKSPHRGSALSHIEYDESPLLRKTSTQRSVSGPDQGLRIAGAGSSSRAISPSSMVSIDDLIARRSWPPVDEENETVGIDTVIHRQEKRTTPSSSRSASQHHHSLRHTPSRDNLRSASTASNRSVGSIGRLRSPDLVRPTSSASNRSDHLPRRVESRRSGDLRSMSRKKNSPTPSFTPALAVAGTIAAGAAIATMMDNRSRGSDMEGIYVSTKPFRGSQLPESFTDSVFPGGSR
jgi:hypothetical protein